MFKTITTAAKSASNSDSENEVAVYHSQQQHHCEGMEGGEASSFETVQGQLSEGEFESSLVNKTPPLSSSSSSHPSSPSPPSRPSSSVGVVSRPDWLPTAPLKNELPVPPSFLKEEMRARSASSGSSSTISPSPFCPAPSFLTEKRVFRNSKSLIDMNSLHEETKQRSGQQKKTDSPARPARQEKSSSPPIDNLPCSSFSSSRPTPVSEHPFKESRTRMTPLDSPSTDPHSQLGREVFLSSRTSEGGGAGLVTTNTICHRASPFSSCSPSASTQIRRRSSLSHPVDSSRGRQDHPLHYQGETSRGGVYTPDDGSAVGASMNPSPAQPACTRKARRNFGDLSHPLPFQGYPVHSSPGACTQSHSVGGGVLASSDPYPRAPEEEKEASLFYSSCVSYSCSHPLSSSLPNRPVTSISKTHLHSSLSSSPAAPPVSPSFPSTQDDASIYWCRYPKGEREETDPGEGRRKRFEPSSLQSGRTQDMSSLQSAGFPDHRHSTRISPSSSPLLPVEVSSPPFSSSLVTGGQSREISSSFLRRRSSEQDDDDDDVENQMERGLDVSTSYAASRDPYASEERKKRFLNEARQNNSFSPAEGAETSPRDSVMPVRGQPRDRGSEEAHLRGQEEGRRRMTKEEEQEFLEIKRKFTREFEREGYIQKTSYVFDTSTGTATSEDQRRDHQEHRDGAPPRAPRYPPHQSHLPNPSSSSSASASSSSHNHRRHSRWLRLFASRLICLGPREGKESFYRRDKTSSRQSGGGGRRRSVSQRIERGFHKISTRRSEEGGEKKAASYRKRFEESTKGAKDMGDISTRDRRKEREEEEEGENGGMRYEDEKHTSAFISQKSSPPVFWSRHGNQKSRGLHSSSASYPFSPRSFCLLSSSRDQEEGGHQAESEPHANTNDVDNTKKKRRRHRFRRHLRDGGGEGKNQFTGSTSGSQNHHPHPVVCTTNSRSVFPSPSPLVYSSSRQSPEVWCSFSSSSMRADVSREEDEGRKSIEESAGRKLYGKEERRDSMASASSSSRGGGGRLRRLRSKRHKDKKSKEERKVDVHHLPPGPCTPEDPSGSGESLYRLSRPNEEDRKEKVFSRDDRIEGQQQIPRVSSLPPCEEKKGENSKVITNHENRNTDGDNDEKKRRDSFYSILDLSDPNYGELSFSHTDTPPATSDEREQKEHFSTYHQTVPAEAPQPCPPVVSSVVHTPEKREHSPQTSSLEKISCRLDNRPGKTTPSPVEKCDDDESPYSHHLHSKLGLPPPSFQRASPQTRDPYHPAFPPPPSAVFVDPSPETHVEEAEENQDTSLSQNKGGRGDENLLDSMLAIKQERQRTGSTTSSALFPKRSQRDEDLLPVPEGERSLSSVMAPSSFEVLSSVSAVHSPSSGSSIKPERKTSNTLTSQRSPSSPESVSSLHASAGAGGSSLSANMESPARGGSEAKKASDDGDTRDSSAQVKREGKDTSLSTQNTKDRADLTEPDDDDEEEEEEDEEQEEEDDSEDEEDEIEDGEGKILSRRRSHHHHRSEQQDDFFSRLDLSSEDLVEYVLKALEERRMAFNSRQHQAVLLQHTKKQSKKASWMRDFSRSSSKQVSSKSPSARAGEAENEQQRSKGGERRRQEERKQEGKEEEEEAVAGKMPKSERGFPAASSRHQGRQGDKVIEEEEDEVGTEDDDEGWDRQRDLLDLAEFLLDASVVCMARELVVGGEEGGKDPGQAPSRQSLRKSSSSSSKSGDFPRVYDKDGLSVWKKEFGAGRVLIRGQSDPPLLLLSHFPLPLPQSIPGYVCGGVRTF